MRIDRFSRHPALAGVLAILLAAALVACSSPPPAAFVGYKWTVVSISHAGKTTPVPAEYGDYLQFTPDGQFAANEPVNSHGGTYRLTHDGFTIGDLTSSAVGYIGRDPVTLVSMSAMLAFSDAHAQASVNGDTLTVTVGGYTLVAQRDGRQASL